MTVAESEIPVYHICPVNDLQIHNTESSICNCYPIVKITEYCVLVVHNSFDGRELVEEANRILQHSDE